jgi:hypothetical protein
VLGTEWWGWCSHNSSTATPVARGLGGREEEEEGGAGLSSKMSCVWVCGCVCGWVCVCLCLDTEGGVAGRSLEGALDRGGVSNMLLLLTSDKYCSLWVRPTPSSVSVWKRRFLGENKPPPPPSPAAAAAASGLCVFL